MQNITEYFYNLALDQGASTYTAQILNSLALLVILIIAVLIVYAITKTILVKLSHKLAASSKTKFDDFLINNKVPDLISKLVPWLILINIVPSIFAPFPSVERPIKILLQVYGIVLIIWILRSILRSLESYFKTKPGLMDKPIDSYIQVLMLFIWIVGLASCFVIFTGIPFWQFFTTLGAASAVLLLIFKDTILGFVASIQVAVNDTVRIGDWITMEKYGADGDVVEINLNTVQVQNFDKTVTIIPTSALLTDAFTNWRGMSDSGGRRIKRAILIKATTIKFLTSEDVDKLKNIELISEYLEVRQKEIKEFNQEHNIDKSNLINGRNLTNFGIFRKYLQSYIEQRPAVNKDMTIMTRQLPPTPHGIPLEIYAFSTDKRWENYEYIMADIFDHSIAAIPYFGLEVFEYDFQQAK